MAVMLDMCVSQMDNESRELSPVLAAGAFQSIIQPSHEAQQTRVPVRSFTSEKIGLSIFFTFLNLFNRLAI